VISVMVLWGENGKNSVYGGGGEGFDAEVGRHCRRGLGQLGVLPLRAAARQRHTQWLSIKTETTGTTTLTATGMNPPPDLGEAPATLTKRGWVTSHHGGQPWWLVPPHCRKVPETFKEFLIQGFFIQGVHVCLVIMAAVWCVTTAGVTGSLGNMPSNGPCLVDGDVAQQRCWRCCVDNS
jgi:hypothetical protein